MCFLDCPLPFSVLSRYLYETLNVQPGRHDVLPTPSSLVLDPPFVQEPKSEIFAPSLDSLSWCIVNQSNRHFDFIFLNIFACMHSSPSFNDCWICLNIIRQGSLHPAKLHLRKEEVSLYWSQYKTSAITGCFPNCFTWNSRALCEEDTLAQNDLV